mmetsp:Transcript_103474/g.183814  ORF Transcript_103474/g.183814 Transcript_103474/m.183814 type:complete len:122 (-) Transcript_103474:232-597(-)
MVYMARAGWHVFLVLSTVAAVDVSWTQYAETAELPMSAQWRNDLHDKLLTIDVDALTPRQKMQRKQLMRQLGPKFELQAATPLRMILLAFVPLLCVVGIAMWLLNGLPSHKKAVKVKKKER